MSTGLTIRGYLEGMRNHAKVEVSDEANTLHKRSLVVDLHNDVLWICTQFKYNMNKKHSPPRYFNPLRPLTDIPRLKKGGVNSFGAGLATFPWITRPGTKIIWLKREMNTLERVISNSNRNLILARSAEDFIKAKSQNKIAIFPGLEGLHMIEGDISNLKDLQNHGLCYITMAHFQSNEAAISNYDKKPKFKGISNFGKEILDEMKRLHLIVDLAHCSKSTLFETMDYVKEPVIVSHTNCHELFPSWRNITDSEIKAVAEQNGVIGIMVSPRFTKDDFCAPLSLVIDHIMHVVEIVGARHAAIGSDIDGFVPTPNGFFDVCDFPQITQLLLNRGLSKNEIEGILGQNFLRVFKRIKGE
jgi:membrane dipeptidase